MVASGLRSSTRGAMANPIIVSPIDLHGQQVDLAAEKPKARIQILKKGRVPHPSAPGGYLNVDDKLLDELYDNFKQGYMGAMLPMGEDHTDRRKRRAKSWVVDIHKTEDGLDADVEFANPELTEAVVRGEVKFVSPEILFNRPIPQLNNQRRNVLKAVDWTNLPYLTCMRPAKIVNLAQVDLANHRESIKSALSELTSTLGPDNVFCGHYATTLLDAVPDFDSDDFEPALAKLEQEVMTSFDFKRYEGEKRQQLEERLPKVLEAIRAFREDAVNLASNAVRDDDDPVNNENVDQDANSDQLPSQCSSCARLEESTCPFQGISVKVAAAADGHCPQYLAKDAEVAPEVSSQDEQQEQEKELKMSLEHEDRFKNMEAQLTELAARNVELETKLSASTTDKTELELALNRIQELELQNQRQQHQSLVDKYVASGKLTPAMATVALSMLQVGTGQEVLLNDEPATVETLLTQLLDNMPVQVELGQTETPTAGEKPVELAQPSGSTELEKLQPLIMERAKQLASGTGKSYTDFYSAAAREVSRERAKGVNN